MVIDATTEDQKTTHTVTVTKLIVSIESSTAIVVTIICYHNGLLFKTDKESEQKNEESEQRNGEREQKLVEMNDNLSRRIDEADNDVIEYLTEEGE
ncbi:hypothetical protein RCL_jg3887.t1 [Rhizophagus clarus]|uniref:Uncharacterized protein n=1 Tax=Rhizophagus clarus TaxID=94130 RepID=A0A8H3KSJ9_9GLOM|nr:hypothetical protein RCL_jg3887.t1 [Rhizophagus clarus]